MLMGDQSHRIEVNNKCQKSVRKRLDKKDPLITKPLLERPAIYIYI